MRKMGLEPTQAQCLQDPQSCSSASSDTSAYRISSGLFCFSLATDFSISVINNFVNNFFHSFYCECGRWDLNPHKRNAYKILSLARLPVPTLPHIAFLWDYFVSPSRRIVVYQNQQTKSIPFLYFFIFRKCFAFSQYLSQFSSAIRLTAT